jgi:hypothetical protein
VKKVDLSLQNPAQAGLLPAAAIPAAWAAAGTTKLDEVGDVEVADAPLADHAGINQIL